MLPGTCLGQVTLPHHVQVSILPARLSDPETTGHVQLGIKGSVKNFIHRQGVPCLGFQAWMGNKPMSLFVLFKSLEPRLG